MDSRPVSGYGACFRGNDERGARSSAPLRRRVATGLTPRPPLQHLERGCSARTGGHAWAWIAAYAAMTGGWARSIAPLRRRADSGGWARSIAPLRRWGAGGVLAAVARCGGGATPRAGRDLEGRLHVMDGEVGLYVSGSAGTHDAGCRCVAARRPARGAGGTGIAAGAGMPVQAVGMTVEIAGVRSASVGGVSVGERVSQGVGSGRDAGQAPLAPPVLAGRRGRGGDAGGTQAVLTRHRRRAGAQCVRTRCRKGGTQTVRAGRPRHNDAGAARTRCPMGGTQTVLTRRPHCSSAGYVSTRCRSSGTQAAMPRRARCGAGSLMTRCPRQGGIATAVN